MASALYLEDAYLTEFKTRVSAVKDGRFVVLMETAFYPNSGGQPPDTGIIIRTSDNERFPVIYTGKFGDEISHEVTKPGLIPGDEVTCRIDWDRRYIHMRMHTAAHLLSYLFHSKAGAHITGNQLGEDKSRIDFDLEEFDREKIDSYFEAANSLVAEDHPVIVSYREREEAERDPSLFKLAKALPESIKTLRIVSIGSIDSQADGGTHVRSLRELGKIAFESAKNKGKNNRRVYFSLDQ